ncbi:transcriptional regulator, TetR family [Nocardia amikacinitolerans]|uniref:TetR/AcrR family transcriptional regulator n=1 Tax=Nocardia amikacinitolerans TaxID=756689 RepID=UPI00082B2C5D|nr:helix-turn-helix domain-containing protein [Nocardia amikacinitolerans]MCP2315263.1 transcriptional regulator, TetR family [Nocardia amikacinitolerans]
MEDVPRESARAKVWRGQTLTDRARERHAQLLRAGFELLGTEGTSGVTVRAVCRHAGLSPRYFYESFTDTDELTTAVYDRCDAELAAAMFANAQRADLAAAVAAAVGAAAEFFAADPRRIRILLREPLANEVLRNRQAEVVPEHLAAAVAAVFELLDADAARPDPAELAMTASALSGALVCLVLDWADGRLAVGMPQLVDHATRLVVTTMTDLAQGRARSAR